MATQDSYVGGVLFLKWYKNGIVFQTKMPAVSCIDLSATKYGVVFVSCLWVLKYWQEDSETCNSGSMKGSVSWYVNLTTNPMAVTVSLQILVVN